VAFFTVFSLTIGHYYHNKYTDEILSKFGSSSSPMAQLLQESKNSFMEETKSRVRGEKSSGMIVKRNDTADTAVNKDDASNNGNGLIHERVVFESIIQRVQWTKQQCDDIPANQRNTVQKKLEAATDLPLLLEGGVAPALQTWLQNSPSDAAATATSREYPTCYLPPSKSCNVTTYTLIIMSHTTERLQTFMDPMSSMVDSWPGMTEVIIVWNSPRDTLTNVVNEKEKEYANKLLSWDTDTTHPVRIFFSLEHGLTNNLLNRYHPKVKPKNEAVMYFDDDGPFWSKEAMIDGGLELWKRNSNVQVGGFPRNVRFLSSRMKELEKVGLQQSIDLIVKDQTNVGVDDGTGPPQFTPLCRNVTGDIVEYNYFVFPDYAAHVLLPSGTFLHRNFLCFIWHPAFEELREYVLTHKTHPDDMTVSTLVSHLAGKAPRTFPREVEVKKSRRLLSEIVSVDNDTTAEEYEQHQPDRSHRRLLWKQKNWFIMREEAINSILGYFGSIHPGTVGWCAGTNYQQVNRRGVPFVCRPEEPTSDLLPWLQDGGVGHNQC
jgi:hypothetical protein